MILAAQTERLLALFRAAGALQVDPGVLLPADVMLDLYGEDIRSRAYLTHDPVLGELMLRPDFTVPVVQMQMEHGAEPARYCYAGPVWRQGVAESVQVGIEVFDGSDVAAADAEVFALVAGAVGPMACMTGDLGIALAAISGLRTSEKRKAALRRHLWRPVRFQRLLERYSFQGPARKFAVSSAKVIGLRGADEIAARLAVLAEDAAAQPLADEQVGFLARVLAVREASSVALAELRGLGGLSAALDRFEARLEALARRGIGDLPFDASYGRAAMEYYDGFVFEFSRGDVSVAQGGRYDAMTRVLGGGKGIPAVGAIVRPEALTDALQAKVGTGFADRKASKQTAEVTRL